MLKNVFKDKRKNLMLILILVFLLPVIIYAAQKIQEYRSRAAGTFEVDMKFNPASGTFHQEDNVSLKVVVQKTSGRNINISGIQAVINVAPEFIVNSISCLAPFTGLPFTKINGQQVTVFCAISPGVTPIALTNLEVPFALLNLTVNPTATEGVSVVYFESTRVTEAGVTSPEVPDVSTGGTQGEYTIALKVTCPRANLGNLNCSLEGCIDTADYELFRQAFGQDASTITVPPDQATPDLFVDFMNLVDTADYEILRSNFGSCGQ